MKKDITPTAAVASGVEGLARCQHFERFCLTAGIAGGDVPRGVEIGEAGVTELRAYAATAVGSRTG